MFAEDGKSSWWVPSSDAPAVAEMFRRIGAQHPVRAISRDLGLSRRAIAHMTRSRTYLGMRGDVEGTWPPIVERDAWAAANAVLMNLGGRLHAGTSLNSCSAT